MELLNKYDKRSPDFTKNVLIGYDIIRKEAGLKPLFSLKNLLKPEYRKLFKKEPVEASGSNADYKSLDNNDGLVGDAAPADCFPKDQLTAQELLPSDANNQWAQVNPDGQGELGDQNFLSAGFHIGVNTVGQSLRNANLQLRSEPANPQVKVSPWQQSTIEPDNNRKPLEIGCEQ